MKKIALPLALVFAAGLATAAEKSAAAAAKPASEASAKTAASPTAAAPAAKPAAAVKTTHKIDGEVVSTDATAKTITIKTADGEKTAPVHGTAVNRLKTLKAGDKVVLTCTDNEKGEHEYVSAIRLSKAPAKKS